MKISILIIIFCIANSTVVEAQKPVVNTLAGKWEVIKAEMDDDIRFDMDNMDSSQKLFMESGKIRHGNQWNSYDSLEEVHNFQEIRSFFQKAFIVFNADSSFTTNLFSDQIESIRGIYSYSAATDELCMKVGGRVLNQDLTKIRFLPGGILNFTRSGPHSDLKSVTFRKK